MSVATWLLLGIGVLGAVDIFLFHTISHGIRSHADSRHELFVHSLRGPTYAALFVIIPNLSLHGAYFWGLVGLLAMDLGISIWDFAIEKHSRALFGGLPTGEYVLHVLIGMLYGAMVASIGFEARQWPALPSAIRLLPAAPDWVRLALALMATIVIYVELGDLRAALRLGRTGARDAASSRQ